MTRRHSQRRGYALILVMVFVVLFGAMLGVAWRRVVSALRVENVSEVRRQSDEGSIPVLAQAMKVLETRLIWDPVNGVLNLNGSSDSPQTYKYPESIGGKFYKVTFTRTADFTSDSGLVGWSVAVTVISDADWLAIVATLPTTPP